MPWRLHPLQSWLPPVNSRHSSHQEALHAQHTGLLPSRFALRNLVLAIVRPNSSILVRGRCKETAHTIRFERRFGRLRKPAKPWQKKLLGGSRSGGGGGGLRFGALLGF